MSAPRSRALVRMAAMSERENRDAQQLVAWLAYMSGSVRSKLVTQTDVASGQHSPLQWNGSPRVPELMRLGVSLSIEFKKSALPAH